MADSIKHIYFSSVDLVDVSLSVRMSVCLSVCMNAPISVIIKAGDTKFGIKVYVYYAQIKLNLNC